MRFLGLITEVFRERRGASHNYSYSHNFSYGGDQVFFTTYSTGMVNIFLSLETQTICLLTLDECIFSQLFASTSISTYDREVELNNSIPRMPVTPFFWFLSSSWIHFILHLQEKWHVRSQGEQDKCLDCIDKHVRFRSSHRFVDVISWLTHEGNVSTEISCFKKTVVHIQRTCSLVRNYLHVQKHKRRLSYATFFFRNRFLGFY